MSVGCLSWWRDRLPTSTVWTAPSPLIGLSSAADEPEDEEPALPTVRPAVTPGPVTGQGWMPHGRVCARLPQCSIDLLDGWCSSCSAFVDPPRERAVSVASTAQDSPRLPEVDVCAVDGADA